MTIRPKVLILHATGTNRDMDAAAAVELAGGQAEIRPINQLVRERIDWSDFQMLVLPGGFSYADALGAGKLMALDLNSYFAAQVQAFVEAGKPVIGICNGFQVLVKAGVLPGRADLRATLTFNQAGHFECRWVCIAARSKICLWTRDLVEPIECPVAHGEGNFILAEQDGLSQLEAADQIALIYAGPDGLTAGGAYPYNPNGSAGDIAGVCNPRGNVLGLMPHPEDHIFSYQHPRWTRGESAGLGLRLFENGMRST
jgi:phosphoribosylformylglycinamidine synthase I